MINRNKFKNDMMEIDVYDLGNHIAINVIDMALNLSIWEIVGYTVGNSQRQLKLMLYSKNNYGNSGNPIFNLNNSWSEHMIILNPPLPKNNPQMVIPKNKIGDLNYEHICCAFKVMIEKTNHLVRKVFDENKIWEDCPIKQEFLDKNNLDWNGHDFVKRINKK